MRELKRHVNRIGATLLALLAVGANAQTDGVVTSAPAPASERWEVKTLVEYYGPKDRAPSKTNRETKTVCLKAGSVDMSAALNTELPAHLGRGCHVGEKRAEENRQQIKFACSNGATAEAATRREIDGSFSSQIVANLPQEWAISIQRNVRRVVGDCDPAIALPAAPEPPLPPATPKQ